MPPWELLERPYTEHHVIPNWSMKRGCGRAEVALSLAAHVIEFKSQFGKLTVVNDRPE